MDLTNVGRNKRKSKDKSDGSKGGFNEYSSITVLVKKYKESQDNNDLLEIIKALEGIINTYTLILTPGNNNQQIYITPYMKKLLGMFLAVDERVSSNNDTYNIAIARIRWIMRQYTYEDVYSQILYILLKVVKNIRIVGDCDCFYYIQWVMIYKVHKYIMDQTKDATINLADVSNNPNETIGEDCLDDVLDRLSFDPENLLYEDKLLDKFDEVDSINILLREDDVFKCFSYYEKYIIYLAYMTAREEKDGSRELDLKTILGLLKYETEEDLFERFEDIHEKLKIIKDEVS